MKGVRVQQVPWVKLHQACLGQLAKLARQSSIYKRLASLGKAKPYFRLDLRYIFETMGELNGKISE